MKAVNRLFGLALLCISLQAQYSRGPNVKPSPQRLVVVGDSLSAGVQNFSLLDTQQVNGYANLIAQQAGWPMTLPLIPFPGAPNVLVLNSISPLSITQAKGTLPNPPRVNPEAEPTNIAIPGLTVNSALNLRPISNLENATPQQLWATIVLGYPNLPTWAPTEIELAKFLKPTLVIEWLGNNDALVPALAGQISALTPVEKFAADYDEVLKKLEATKARIVTATIPDVTEIPFFMSPAQIAALIQAQSPGTVVTPQEVAAGLGIGLKDYVRICGQGLVDEILTGAKPGPLSAYSCQALPGLGAATVSCILTEADAKTIRATVNCYNLIISVETAFHGGTVVDIHKLVNKVYVNGYTVKNTSTRLTTSFLGGLFSLDGIHPSNTGYAVIANEFINTMNARLGTKIPAVNVANVLAKDPLYLLPGTPAGALPPNPGLACCK